MKIRVEGLQVSKIDEHYEVIDHGHIWKMEDIDTVLIKDGVHYLLKDHLVRSYIDDTRIYEMIVSEYAIEDLSFRTYVYIEPTTKEIHFEVEALEDAAFEELIWPGYFKSTSKDGYSALPIMQGVLLKNDYDYDYDKLDFDGQFMSHDAYLSMYMQREDDYGYLAIIDSAADTKYDIRHKADTLKTAIGIRHLSSLSKLNHRRSVRYYFKRDLDYVSASKYYRHDLIEKGHFKTLKEKELALPDIKKMVGTAFIHFGIKSHTDPDSSYYTADSKDIVITFKERQKQLSMIKEHYDGKLYVHIDGWAQPGYDNRHPDYYPVCEEAGGSKELKELVEMIKSGGDVCALHDQYRDYYLKSEHYDIKNATKEKDGKAYEHARWAGGRQNYLCASLALSYVRRNFQKLFDEDIRPNASYLDVFTCNEMDECFDIDHLMRTSECDRYRGDCFRYLVASGIIPTSEECADWASDVLVSCHYGPYEFMLKRPGSKKMGIPIPLFDLVYHDSMILPWMMDVVNGEDYMLYCLLNGGAPYLIREGAYPDTDGAFGFTSELEKAMDRSKVASLLHSKVAYDELVDHEILDEEGKIQRSVFKSGITVEVDFNDNSYKITGL